MVQTRETTPFSPCLLLSDHLPLVLSAVNELRRRDLPTIRHEAWVTVKDALRATTNRSGDWRNWVFDRSPRCVHLLRHGLAHRWRESMMVDDREALASMLDRAEAEADGNVLESVLEVLLDHPAQRLAVYGSLALGRPNHHRLDRFGGRWMSGSVSGELRNEGWGARMGCPGLVLTRQGSPVSVEVLESDDLALAWIDFDRFEGEEYLRSLAVVRRSDGGRVVANIYALRRTVTKETENP